MEVDIHEADYVLLLRDSGVCICLYCAVCEVEPLKFVFRNRNPTAVTVAVVKANISEYPDSMDKVRSPEKCKAGDCIPSELVDLQCM